MTDRASAEGLRERSDAATPGPWWYDSYSRIYGGPPTPGEDGDPEYTQVIPLPKPTRGDVTTAQGVADAYFIVEAVNYVRAALRDHTGVATADRAAGLDVERLARVLQVWWTRNGHMPGSDDWGGWLGEAKRIAAACDDASLASPDRADHDYDDGRHVIEHMHGSSVHTHRLGEPL